MSSMSTRFHENCSYHSKNFSYRSAIFVHVSPSLYQTSRAVISAIATNQRPIPPKIAQLHPLVQPLATTYVRRHPARPANQAKSLLAGAQAGGKTGYIHRPSPSLYRFVFKVKAAALFTGNDVTREGFPRFLAGFPGIRGMPGRVVGEWSGGMWSWCHLVCSVLSLNILGVCDIRV